MKKSQTTERNNLGDKEFMISPFDLVEFRKSQYTYVFKYWDSKRNCYIPYFDLFSKSTKRLEKAQKLNSFTKIELYKSPKKPPYDFHILHANTQLGMLIEFFKEVFHERSFKDGHIPTNKYYSVILPEEKYHKIINCINDYSLLPIKDLLFEVISTAQHIYTKDIAFWERTENKKLITSAGKETNKVLKVLEKTDTNVSLKTKGKKPATLMGINFIFNDESIKVEHQWLASEFIDHFRQYYDTMHFKNWRKDLGNYPHRFDENRDKLQFKFRFARALYNLLTKTGLYKIDIEKPFPNELMICIARLIEFCLIPVAGDGEIENIKAKNVRNWIRRNEIKPALTYVPIDYNRERLLKYFERDFIELGEQEKRVDALNSAAFIAVRFDANPIMEDLAHIIQCLQQLGWLIGHQVTGSGIRTSEEIPELQNFKQLLDAAKKQTRLTSMKFTIEGDDKEHEITQELPLHLIEEALRKYQKEERVEIDTDIVKTSVKKLEDGSFQVTNETRFSLPKERFLVRFTAAFYNYLLKEIPPKQDDYHPSEKYYAIIALVLIHSRMFYTNNIDEQYAILKVKNWHKIHLS